LLRQLFDNDWVTLAAREHAHDSWRRRTRTGWRTWLDTRAATPQDTPGDKEMIP